MARVLWSGADRSDLREPSAFEHAFHSREGLGAAPGARDTVPVMSTTGQRRGATHPDREIGYGDRVGYGPEASVKDGAGRGMP